MSGQLGERGQRLGKYFLFLEVGLQRILQPDPISGLFVSDRERRMEHERGRSFLGLGLDGRSGRQ